MSLGLNSMQCEPRFVVWVAQYRWDDRDVPYMTGWVKVGTAETKKFATFVAGRGDEYDYESNYKIVDLHPERDPANWGPVEGPKPIVWNDGDDLPF